MVSGKKIVLIKSNLVDLSTRLSKEINTLVEGGYSVSLLVWDRESSFSTSRLPERQKLWKELRLRLKAPYGIKVVPLLPVWWGFAFFKLMLMDWDIAHAINFDSAIPATIAGRLKRKPVIYEILDTYEDQVRLPRILRTLIIMLDKLIMRLSSSIILADEMQIEEIAGIPNSKVITIYDSPPDIWQGKLKKSQKNDLFTLFFAGGLLSARVLNLDKIVNAIENIEGVKVVLAGYGDLVDEIKKWTQKMPEKVQFLGEISHKEVLQRCTEANLLFILRSTIIPVNKYICGSKLFEAMMSGTPLLVNQGTSTAIKVSQENCGLVVDANNINEIKKGILRLRDNPGLCQELGANARKAYDQKYSWEIMEQRLLTLYQELTRGSNNARQANPDKILTRA